MLIDGDDDFGKNFDYRHIWELERDREREVEALDKQKRQLDQQHFYQSIGQVLRKHRLKKKMSQKSVALCLNLHENDIFKIEKGEKRITLYVFMRACSLLDIDFRFSGRFALEESEFDFIRALRQRDYKFLLSKICEEI